jgi:hypothetical protein
MKNRAPIAVLVVAALAVAYALGTGRSETPAGRAVAGPSEFTKGGDGVYMTNSADGATMYVWKMKDYQPFEVHEYRQEGAFTQNTDGTLQPPKAPKIVTAVYPLSPPAAK